MEVVVAVPFQPFAGHARLVGKGAHNALHGARQGRAGIGHAVAHSVAQANLDGHAALLGKLHEALRQRQAETVNVGPRHVLEVTARNDAPFQRLFRKAYVHVHGLLPRFAQFEENMIVRHAGKHACFVKFHVPRELEVFLIGADPGRDAGEAVAARAADFHAFAISGGVQKEFRRRNEAGLAAEAMQEIEHSGHLLDGIGRAGLLTVAEGGIGDVHLLCRTRRQQGFVERGPTNAGVGEYVAVQLRFVAILQLQGAAAACMMKYAHVEPPVRDIRKQIIYGDLRVASKALPAGFSVLLPAAAKCLIVCPKE